MTDTTPPGRQAPIAPETPENGVATDARTGTARRGPVLPRLTQGSVMRHVIVMSATGWIGLIAVFVVDFLNLFYIARLGQQELAAAIGYSGALLFFFLSFGIGFTIAVTALCARALGAGRHDDARRLATSGVVLTTAALGALTIALWPFLGEALAMIGATGRTREIATDFLRIVLPATPLLAVGMALSGVLRAAGDARRAMHVTLIGGLVTAVLDPLMIFGFGLGITGAAITTVISRLTIAYVGWHGAVAVHGLLARPRLADLSRDLAPLATIAVPAILTNVATPVANTFVTATVARFGDSAVAGYAVVDRLVPLAFGGIFALSGAIGPVFGQNLGAKLYDRVRATLTASLIVTTVYSLIVWAALAVLAGDIAAVFNVRGEGAAIVAFFCRFAAGSFIFVGALFVANASFNNLGFPIMSTLFNWGRATLGTIPFVLVGAAWMGAIGPGAGFAVGSVVFGSLAVVAAYRVVARIGAVAKPAN